MRHLKHFATLQESAQKPTGLIGFALAFSDQIYVGAQPTFDAFARKAFSAITAVDLEEPIFDLNHLSELLDEETDVDALRMVTDTFSSYSAFWWGLEPRGGRGFEAVLNLNPFSAADYLQSLFTNARPLMSRHPSGMRSSADYLSRSVDNDPGILAWLRDNDSREGAEFTLEEILAGCKTPKRELELLMSLHDIKPFL